MPGSAPYGTRPLPPCALICARYARRAWLGMDLHCPPAHPWPLRGLPPSAPLMGGSLEATNPRTIQPAEPVLAPMPWRAPPIRDGTSLWLARSRAQLAGAGRAVAASAPESRPTGRESWPPAAHFQCSLRSRSPLADARGRAVARAGRHGSAGARCAPALPCRPPSPVFVFATLT